MPSASDTGLSCPAACTAFALPPQWAGAQLHVQWSLLLHSISHALPAFSYHARHPCQKVRRSHSSAQGKVTYESSSLTASAAKCLLSNAVLAAFDGTDKLR